MKYSPENLVGNIVAQDYRTASVFKSHKIDFCCKGGRSLSDVCEKQQINVKAMINQLEEATATASSEFINFQSWDMDLLVAYIEKKHHRYVNQKIPEIKSFLHKVTRVHGERHPELFEVEALFNASSLDLLAHMEKEEKILFPYLKMLALDNAALAPNFGTVQNPISMMMQEHDHEGERFRMISKLTNNYTPPPDACTTYRVVFAMLAEFEEDLHRHIHLENNVLFPKAVAAEREEKLQKRISVHL